VPSNDWINLIAYDYYGPWSHQTGANAPLSADSTPGGNTFIGRSVDNYLDQHVPPEKTPFAYNPSSHTFISYDDPKSVALKAAFVNQRHLGGAMFWALDLDDFKHGYPLLSAAKRALISAP